MLEVPSDYKTAGIMTLVSGVLNLMNAFFLAIAWLSSIFLAPVACLYIVPGIFAFVQIGVGVMVMQGKPMPMAKTLSLVGAIVSLLNCQWIGTILEGLAFTFHGKPEVTAWLEEQPA